MRCVLVPEAATLLIEADLSVPRKKAIKTLKQSQVFGSKYHSGEDSPHLKKLIDQTTSSTAHVEAGALESGGKRGSSGSDVERPIKKEADIDISEQPDTGPQVKMEVDIDLSLTDLDRAGKDNNLEGFRVIKTGEKVVYELLD